MGRSIEIPTASENTPFNANHELAQKSLTLAMKRRLAHCLYRNNSYHFVPVVHTHYYRFKFWGHAWNSGGGHRWFDWKMNSKKLPPPPALDFMFWAPVLSIRRTTCLISVLHKRNLSIKTININWLILFLSPLLFSLLPVSPLLLILISPFSCHLVLHVPITLFLSLSLFLFWKLVFLFFF